MLAYEPLGIIENCFSSKYKNAECPKEIAVFVRHESERRLHCEVKTYFSPASIDVAQELDAKPCEKPSPEGLSLLIGSEESWLILFPEHTR